MFTLHDLLELPLMQSARPEVLFGDEFDQREVRWVHTSEIFEISPLLKGGEVLFTTGLGLVGAPVGSITAYVKSLATQNVTALIMEVGRTFVHLPDEFIEAARRFGLPLITMHRVVPFVEFTEVIHPLLISPEIEGLRSSEQAYRQLISGMLAGDDVEQIIAATQSMVETDIGLYSTGGQLLAGDDVRANHDQLNEYEVGPEPWAMLVAVANDKTRTHEVLSAAASAVALKLSQKAIGDPSRALAVGDLLADIMRGHFRSPKEIQLRAGELGFELESKHLVVPIVIDLTRAARSGLAAVTKATRREFGANLLAEIDGRIVVVVQIKPDDIVEVRLLKLITAIDFELSQSGEGHVVRIVTGPVVDSIAGLGASLPRVESGARLARRLAFPAQIVTDRDLGLYDLLTRVVPDTELEQFVDQQLGPLLQADARSGNRLVETLNAFLENGMSKSAAANALGIRRQTMYQRLERISRLLGGIDLESRERLTALDLAVTAWRMRTSGLTGLRES